VCSPSVQHDWYGATQCPVPQSCTVRGHHHHHRQPWAQRPLVSDAIVTIAAHRCLSRAAWLNSCRVAPHHCSMSSDHFRWGRPLLFEPSIIPNTRVFFFLLSFILQIWPKRRSFLCITFCSRISASWIFLYNSSLVTFTVTFMGRGTVQNIVMPERIPCRVPCCATDVHQSGSYNVQLRRLCRTLELRVPWRVPDSVPCSDPPVIRVTVPCDVHQCCRSSCRAGLRADPPVLHASRCRRWPRRRLVNASTSADRASKWLKCSSGSQVTKHWLRRCL